LQESEGEVLVEQRQFRLQEHAGADVLAAEYIPDEEGGLTAIGTTGGVLLGSAGNDHYASVRIELWSGRAPCGQGAWDTVREETFTVSATGQIEAMTLMGESAAPPVILPVLGSYRIRVHVSGRREAAELDEATFVRGVERWLLQIWPTDE
jgi:hypothetical protein